MFTTWKKLFGTFSQICSTFQFSPVIPQVEPEPIRIESFSAKIFQKDCSTKQTKSPKKFGNISNFYKLAKRLKP